MGLGPPGIAIVTRPTRLEGLQQRWGTAGQAKFRLQQAHAQEAVRRAGPDVGPQRNKRGPPQAAAPLPAAAANATFSEYEEEARVYGAVIERLRQELDFGLPVRIVERQFVPNFEFGYFAAVVVVGQDGLVANVAKYVGDLPIVAINPDPRRFDGVLLRFKPDQARAAVSQVLEGKHRLRRVTLAEALLNDGQRMLAFNDLFVGAASHVSARYTLEVGGRSEPQSSSGIIVSTGAGSTGWLSSVFNMAGGVARFLGSNLGRPPALGWEERKLLWAVREPFVSRQSQADLTAGGLREGEELVVESLMPEGGVIFSDGIESDFLPFTSGTIARIAVSKQQANLVV